MDLQGYGQKEGRGRLWSILAFLPALLSTLQQAPRNSGSIFYLKNDFTLISTSQQFWEEILEVILMFIDMELHSRKGKWLVEVVKLTHRGNRH